MTEQIIMLALAVLPVIVLAVFIYRKDKFEKEPLKMLVRAFLFGCLSVLPAIFLESFLSSLYTGFGGDSLPGVFSGLYNGFVVAGSSEELSKLRHLQELSGQQSYSSDNYTTGDNDNPDVPNHGNDGSGDAFDGFNWNV